MGARRKRQQHIRQKRARESESVISNAARDRHGTPDGWMDGLMEKRRVLGSASRTGKRLQLMKGRGREGVRTVYEGEGNMKTRKSFPTAVGVDFQIKVVCPDRAMVG